MLTCQAKLYLSLKHYPMNVLCSTTADLCVSDKAHLVTIKGNYCTYNMKELRHLEGGVGQCFVVSTTPVTNFAFRIGVKFKTTTVALPNTPEQFVCWALSCDRKMLEILEKQ